MDWLNRVTAEGLNFFGLEIELWKISGSKIAPKFNIVSQPNNWAKMIRSGSQRAAGDLTDRQQAHLDFWSQFREYMVENDSPIGVGKPSKDDWKRFPIGRGEFALKARNGMRDGFSAISLSLYGDDSNVHFRLLRDQMKDEIENVLGAVQWEDLPNAIESRITVLREVSPEDRDGWPELNDWYRTTLEKWDTFFRPIVKNLNAADYVEPDE